MQPEDQALLVAVVIAALGSIGSVLTGDVRFAAFGTIMVAIGAALKAMIPPRTP